MFSKQIIHQVEVDVAILFILVAWIGIGIALWENYHPHISRVSPLPPPQATVPSPTIAVKEPEMTPWLSSDGKEELQMQTVYFSDNSKTYRFYVKDLTSGVRREIFSNAVSAEKTIRIPFNSWSPNDTYVYLEEIANGQTRYLVIKASGEQFAKDEQSLDASSLFAAQQTGYLLHEITGWADSTLLIATTTTQQKEEGPSYWLDVSSQSLIQLSTRF